MLGAGGFRGRVFDLFLERFFGGLLFYSPGYDRDVVDLENSFYLRSDRHRLGTMLGQYGVDEHIVGLPGAVAECGASRGGPLIRFPTFGHALKTDKSRKIIGFDAFRDCPSVRASAAEFGRRAISKFPRVS